MSSFVAGAKSFSLTLPPITRTTLALYAGASGDHNPIHIDTDMARDSGFPDVFAHGMLVMAYLGRALTDAIPQHTLRSFKTRFVAITQLGDAITCEGTVAEIVERNGERLARLTLTARNQEDEVKLQGEALVAIP